MSQIKSGDTVYVVRPDDPSTEWMDESFYSKIKHGVVLLVRVGLTRYNYKVKVHLFNGTVGYMWLNEAEMIIKCRNQNSKQAT